MYIYVYGVCMCIVGLPRRRAVVQKVAARGRCSSRLDFWPKGAGVGKRGKYAGDAGNEEVSFEAELTVGVRGSR